MEDTAGRPWSCRA